MNPDLNLDEENLTFDSFFEGGNLDMVSRVRENEFDLYMRVDSNTKGHHQWFYFEIRNRRRCTVKFNVVNFTKADSLYKQGMKLNVLSEKSMERRGTWGVDGWSKEGENIKYGPSKVINISEYASPDKKYYSLSFEYTFPYDDDKTWIAYSIPYSFSKLL